MQRIHCPKNLLSTVRFELFLAINNDFAPWSLTPPTVLLQYLPKASSIKLSYRAPANCHLSGELNALSELPDFQDCRSICNSLSVGSLKPSGQGLFIPSTPCHNLLF
jgi:hypothetical protein